MKILIEISKYEFKAKKITNIKSTYPDELEQLGLDLIPELNGIFNITIYKIKDRFQDFPESRLEKMFNIAEEIVYRRVVVKAPAKLSKRVSIRSSIGDIDMSESNFNYSDDETKVIENFLALRQEKLLDCLVTEGHFEICADYREG
jgi:hypothetical protein